MCDWTYSLKLPITSMIYGLSWYFIVCLSVSSLVSKICRNQSINDTVLVYLSICLMAMHARLVIMHRTNLKPDVICSNYTRMSIIHRFGFITVGKLCGLDLTFQSHRRSIGDGLTLFPISDLYIVTIMSITNRLKTVWKLFPSLVTTATEKNSFQDCRPKITPTLGLDLVKPYPPPLYTRRDCGLSPK